MPYTRVDIDAPVDIYDIVEVVTRVSMYMDFMDEQVYMVNRRFRALINKAIMRHEKTERAYNAYNSKGRLLHKKNVMLSLFALQMIF